MASRCISLLCNLKWNTLIPYFKFGNIVSRAFNLNRRALDHRRVSVTSRSIHNRLNIEAEAKRSHSRMSSFSFFPLCLFFLLFALDVASSYASFDVTDQSVCIFYARAKTIIEMMR